MPFTASNSLRFSATLTGPGDLGTDTAELNMTYPMPLVNGTAANQADRMFKDTRTVADGATDDIDLTAVEDAFGTALGAAEVVTIFIRSNPTNTTNLTIGGSTADYAGMPDQTISPGGIVLVHNQGVNGLGAVVDTTGDTIRVVNAAGAQASYEIVVIARSA